MQANLRSDEQKSQEANIKDKAADQVEVQNLHGINVSRCGRYMERKILFLPEEISQVWWE